MFFCFVLIPFCSPVSFKALLSPSAFVPGKKIDGSRGNLVPDESTRTRSVMSRISDLWNHVRRCRNDFENTPDTGMLGKNFARPMNMLWNYFVKGFLGTMTVLLIIPPICVVASSVSIVFGLVAPVFACIASVLWTIIMVLVLDFENPRKHEFAVVPIFQAYIWLLLIRGIFQFILSVLAAFIFLPLYAVFRFFLACALAFFRTCWDTSCLYCVIKPRGRVPGSNSWVAVRIKGPGVAAKYVYQVMPQQALAALKLQIELDELDAFEEKIKADIQKPRQEFVKFFNQLLNPLYITNGSPDADKLFQDLTIKEQELSKELATKLRDRKRLIKRNDIDRRIRNSIKMPKEDLDLTIECSAKMLEMLYPEHVIAPSGSTVAQFFNKRGLKPLDWKTLAQQKLAEIFSDAFILPIEKTDEVFSLEVDHLKFGDLFDWVLTSQEDTFKDDLEKVVSRHDFVSSPSLQYQWPPAEDRVPLVAGAKKKEFAFCSLKNFPDLPRLLYGIHRRSEEGKKDSLLAGENTGLMEKIHE